MTIPPIKGSGAGQRIDPKPQPGSRSFEDALRAAGVTRTKPEHPRKPGIQTFDSPPQGPPPPPPPPPPQDDEPIGP